ncbi:hypothetical protein Cassandra_0288 [Pseudomonas phage Cassandra]|uniref:Uncharacterized protein n=1 Tax=Pseudomonas phage vB_PaeM_PA5oct TaxID=2163605 RepID=A0A4Y1LU25_9CAUD|nr:hypothetical protein PQE65_gp025 [Pseudomonas phage vB_PaeM_PA5oct]QCG75909.1 hypothetical protein EST35_0025 [Pseudomonas phage vB_PaeM_PA5oct]WPK38964.1 hypothetical protein Cassandra_0288 [Pseudomonas phage Cassandra]WPK39484.1 hypothetical protein Deiofobo_0287 [Pseudomonas phage Deifobo]WPK40518.1 hypothetical protein Paride_0288 [Pseudomonas phage Paride]
MLEYIDTLKYNYILTVCSGVESISFESFTRSVISVSIIYNNITIFPCQTTRTILYGV